MRKKFCPDVQIRSMKTVAWIAANSEPLSQRRRWEMNSATYTFINIHVFLRSQFHTVVGTSVTAFADLTYRKLKTLNIGMGKDEWECLQPCLIFLRHDFEAKNSILSKIHVSFWLAHVQHNLVGLKIQMSTYQTTQHLLHLLHASFHPWSMMLTDPFHSGRSGAPCIGMRWKHQVRRWCSRRHFLEACRECLTFCTVFCQMLFP